MNSNTWKTVFRFVKRQKAVISVSICFFLTLMLHFHIKNQPQRFSKLERDRLAALDYEDQLAGVNGLDDNSGSDLFAELDPNEVPLNSGIFFFVSDGAKDLEYAQACSVEAAARQNTGKKVFVIFLSSNVTDVIFSPSLSTLISFHTVSIRYVKLSKIFHPHPELLNWFVKSNFHHSKHMRHFLKHALTYTFLHKFGGTVLDFDTIVFKNLEMLGQFFSRCSEDSLQSSPMRLNSRHELLDHLLGDFDKYYDESNPESTGSNLITSKVKALCKVSFTKELAYKDCKKSAHPLKVDALCPIEESKAWMIVDPVRRKLVQKTVSKPDVYGIRTWGDLNADVPNWGGPDFLTAFYAIAQDQCPLTLMAIGPKSHF